MTCYCSTASNLGWVHVSLCSGLYSSITIATFSHQLKKWHSNEDSCCIMSWPQTRAEPWKGRGEETSVSILGLIKRVSLGEVSVLYTVLLSKLGVECYRYFWDNLWHSHQAWSLWAAINSILIIHMCVLHSHANCASVGELIWWLQTSDWGALFFCRVQGCLFFICSN